jgi:hypothetical protein
MSAQHTPGPWAWFGKGSCNDIYLATTHSGRRFIMGFKRWGTQGAEPTFQVEGRMVPASSLAKFEVGDNVVVGLAAAKVDPSVYRYDINGIDHPDARLIASAPELLEALEEVASWYTAPMVFDPNDPLQNKVRAALAKARGAAS